MRKSTFACIRNIDELGRVVIPKDIRNELRIEAGDPLEVFARNGEVVFKPASGRRPAEDIRYLIEQYGENEEVRSTIERLKLLID